MRWLVCDLLLLAAVVAVPVVRFAYFPTGDPHPPQWRSFPTADPGFRAAPVRDDGGTTPYVLNLVTADLDGDGRRALVVCDQRREAVLAYRRDGDAWREEILAEGLEAPCHVDFADLDGDGDADAAVAVLGDVFPNAGRIGRVVALERDGGSWTPRVLADDLHRVADVRCGDLDGDGDLDLAVAEFGQLVGGVWWFENRGDWDFHRHDLHRAPGAIHVPLRDYDGDGDLDIATVISQDDEEVLIFANRGDATFERHRVFDTVNYELGSAGLVADDLDGDGDPDLLLAAGDNFETAHPQPQPWHGCYWLENRGVLEFAAHRIGHLPGTYGVAAGDLDGDGDRDVAMVSMANDWINGERSSVVALFNDGSGGFLAREIARDPISQVTVAIDDLDGDGRAELYTGGLSVFPPFRPAPSVIGWERAR